MLRKVVGQIGTTPHRALQPLWSENCATTRRTCVKGWSAFHSKERPMRLSWTSGLLGALLALGVLTLAGTTARTADDKKPADKTAVGKGPFVGNGKGTVLFAPTLENTSFIVKIADKDGRPEMDTV